MTDRRATPGEAALERARAALRAAGLPTPDLDLRRLAREATADELAARIRRRIAGEPVSRILGRRGFWTLDLVVAPAVLDPRPDTETVVEAALQALRVRPVAAPRLLDVGTGSGAILLALLAECPTATGLGIDLSAGAVSVAGENAARHGLGDRACFEVADLSGYSGRGFDLVVSNPPYVRSADIALLAAEVRDHDPRLALDGGPDGLDAYRALLPRLGDWLVPDGTAVLEIGAGQAPAIMVLARGQGWQVGPLRKDLAGIDRALTLRRNSPDGSPILLGESPVRG